MTRSELIEAGVRIYGARWLAPLARTLGVNRRTMDRWAAGKSPIPEGIGESIATLALIAARRRPHEPRE
jgi:hypothetical protein